jgi:ubiquinone/menaquinone biosynthesis C-methylase UbiE
MRQKGATKDKKCLMLGPEIPLNDDSYCVVRCSQESDQKADYRVSYDNLPFETAEFDFVVVSDLVLDLERHLKEWKRVSKIGSKIAFNLHPHLLASALCLIYKGTVNGSFIEIINV